MSRKALRLTILIALLGAVIALGIRNSLSNARLVRDLQASNPHAFAELADRQDAYNLLQVEPVAHRYVIARNLANWKDPRAPKVILGLLKDPDPKVREALTTSLIAATKRYPRAVAQEMTAGGPAEKAGIIEAVSKTGEEGPKVAKLAFAKAESRGNAAILFLRIGQNSVPALTELLISHDRETALSAADTLARIGTGSSRTKVASEIWNLFAGARTQGERDRILFALSVYAPPQAEAVFVDTLRDQAAPTQLRVFAVNGLAELKKLGLLEAAKNDYDERVARAAQDALHFSAQTASPRASQK